MCISLSGIKWKITALMGFYLGLFQIYMEGSFEKPEGYTKQNVIKTAEKYVDRLDKR